MGTLNASDYKQPRMIAIQKETLPARYYIRKLTPRECWRLQSFTDEQFDKATAAGLSDTQLYKQAGNAVTVNVIREISKNILPYLERTYRPNTTLRQRGEDRQAIGTTQGQATKTITQYVQEAHKNAITKGWHDEPRSLPELIALMHAELSEALEDYRDGYAPNEMYYQDGRKPCGIPSELADVVIRIFDACGQYGIDLEAAINEKMAYNATRPHRHGGKVL